MNLEELTKDKLVTDKEKTYYGVGRVEGQKDGLTYVWFDDVESTIHYREDELKFLEPL